MPLTALSTDLYQITMVAGYYAAGLMDRATFELSVRQLPPRRSFLICAGLEQALDYLEGLRVGADDIEYLRHLSQLRGLPSAFFDEYLPSFHFTGDVWAVSEGTPIFETEPLIQIIAPLPQAQIVETALLSILMFQTMIASKTARVVQAAAGRPVMEFGARRAHGPGAALYAARAAVLAGCEATSLVEAGRRFGIPLAGTMAHSWVMAFPEEMEAFEEYDRLFQDRAVLLLDTYDTLTSARRLAASTMRPRAVRLDSGDAAMLSRAVRKILDDAGLTATKIFVSGDLDEDRIADLVEQGAPVDGFGVGTAISTSNDAPALGGIYKLVEIDRNDVRTPTAKASPGKVSWAGRKQVWRRRSSGIMMSDTIALADEPPPPGAEPLLHRVMKDGRRENEPAPLRSLRERCLEHMKELPEEVRRLKASEPYPVNMTPALMGLSRDVWAMRKRGGGQG